MQNYLPYIYGQIEFLENNLNLLKKTVLGMDKKKQAKNIYGCLPKTDLTFGEFRNLRKTFSSSWENEWK